MARSRILVVEDSKFFSNLVCRSIAERIDAEIVVAASLAETKQAQEAATVPFNLALVDLVLPDAPEGEAADWLQERSVPCIVFTGYFSEDLRERLLAQRIIDYVVKDTPASLEYLLNLVERLHRNRNVKVLVVDDSRISRRYIVDLLRSYQFQVIEADNGLTGLEQLRVHPDVRMVVTDYHMPEMDGVEMVRRMREIYNQENLIIIGISSGGGSALSARFIKFGANDFIIKPFLREEFFCRVMQNARILDMVDRLNDLATKDVLTSIHNRRFFFEAGKTLMASAKREHLSLTAAIIDVDFFKRVNDDHGHDIGDFVLKRIAALLRQSFRQTDIVSRFGGEEFAILSVNMDKENVVSFFEKLRLAFEAEEIINNGKRISITASFGVCCGEDESLERMLKLADEALYRAKQNGRNRVELFGA